MLPRSVLGQGAAGAAVYTYRRADTGDLVAVKVRAQHGADVAS
jgi:hypothetical protein